jgi:nitrogen regulatory protein PII
VKLLTVVVKPFKAEAVLKTLAELEVVGLVIREAKGYSRQKNYLARYLGSEFEMAFLPKVEISFAVADEQANTVAEKVAQVARTGRMGDGKVFVLPISWPDPIEF